MGQDLDLASETSSDSADAVASSIQTTLTEISDFLSGGVDGEPTPEESLGETFRAMLAELGLVLPQDGEGIEGVGPAALFSLIAGAAFAGGEGEEGEHPFQAMIAQAIANMLTVGGEDGESPLQPLFEALDVHVKGEGENAGKGGLFGELIAFVKGSGDDEGKGGLIAILNQHVRGGEGKQGGLIGELNKVVHGENGLIAQLNKEGGRIMDAIQALWNRLFGTQDKWHIEQGDE